MDIKNFDVSVIYTREDGSYVVNQGLYHVPNEGEWVDLYQQVKQYAEEHPEVVMPEPVYEPTYDEVANSVRSQRDYLIGKTDYLLLPDYAKKLDEASMNEVLAYREALRNVPAQEGFPYDISWPEQPVIVRV